MFAVSIRTVVGQRGWGVAPAPGSGPAPGQPSATGGGARKHSTRSSARSPIPESSDNPAPVSRPVIAGKGARHVGGTPDHAVQRPQAHRWVAEEADRTARALPLVLSNALARHAVHRAVL